MKYELDDTNEYYDDPTPDYDVFERHQLDLDADIERRQEEAAYDTGAMTLEGLQDHAANMLLMDSLDSDDVEAERHYSMQYIAARQALALERIADILANKFL